ncbi:hypothetical protein AAFF_G00271070 [Aldrovandia affinis]|uniref:Uncharacterized protein n=1 Tax=Aldrovandia affinis TaxID=143900 RepID=A0AAD7RB79_9TELE|nr:hypothetical protein AAFF_G00271070 [Aldrovandia affinis]
MLIHCFACNPLPPWLNGARVRSATGAGREDAITAREDLRTPHTHARRSRHNALIRDTHRPEHRHTPLPNGTKPLCQDQWRQCSVMAKLVETLIHFGIHSGSMLIHCFACNPPPPWLNGARVRSATGAGREDAITAREDLRTPHAHARRSSHNALIRDTHRPEHRHTPLPNGTKPLCQDQWWQCNG